MSSSFNNQGYGQGSYGGGNRDDAQRGGFHNSSRGGFENQRGGYDDDRLVFLSLSWSLRAELCQARVLSDETTALAGMATVEVDSRMSIRTVEVMMTVTVGRSREL